MTCAGVRTPASSSRALLKTGPSRRGTTPLCEGASRLAEAWPRGPQQRVHSLPAVPDSPPLPYRLCGLTAGAWCSTLFERAVWDLEAILVQSLLTFYFGAACVGLIVQVYSRRSPS